MGILGFVCVQTWFPRHCVEDWQGFAQVEKMMFVMIRSGAESFSLRSVCYSVSSPQLQILGFMNRTVGKMLSQNHPNAMGKKKIVIFLAPPGRTRQVSMETCLPHPISLCETRIPAMGWAQTCWQLWLSGFRSCWNSISRLFWKAEQKYCITCCKQLLGILVLRNVGVFSQQTTGFHSEKEGFFCPD